MLYIDLTEKMFEAVKSPVVASTFWHWVRGERVQTGHKVILFDDDIYRIETDVPNHYIYLKKGRRGWYVDHVYLEEILIYTGQALGDKMDVTSFGRLLGVSSIHDLPRWTPWRTPQVSKRAS
jgi:hypothetical protein